MTDDLKRLEQEYARRRQVFSTSDRYSTFNPSYLFTIQQRQRATVDLLKQHGLADLADSKILEIGCGGGDVIYDYLWHRLNLTNLFGVDLLPDRLDQAQQRFPSVNLARCDAQHLPFADKSFDITLQYTVFSSILDNAVKTQIARDMLRVTRKAIVWYDFWLNPTNSQTKGIRKAEIRRLFPDCEYHFKKITLAPPLVRRLVPITWIGSLMLEKLSVFNTHYLAIIRPKK